MNIDPAVMHDCYPLRSVEPSTARTRKHSSRSSSSEFYEITKRYEFYFQQLQEDDVLAKQRSRRLYDAQQLDPEVIAREFARYAVTVKALHQQDISHENMKSAYSLINRQVDVVPWRIDRVQAAGMAAVVLACSGFKVHLVLDNGRGMSYIDKWLFPILGEMGYSSSRIKEGTGEEEHRQAYQQEITVVDSRDCAMDFLRDAMKWPQRLDPIERSLDPLLGIHSNCPMTLMRGLHCAILVDADSALIDKAIAPIALTRQADHIYEANELKQALQMVSHLEKGRHFVFACEETEVELTDLGKRQLSAWAEQLGGNWLVEHVAELMLSAALVVVHLIRSDMHYRIRHQTIDWLVDDSLIPGMSYYTKPLLASLVELKEECEYVGHLEVAARASYQQIFNRYVHLCGLCHSVKTIEKELRKVYGLSCNKHRQDNQTVSYDESYLVHDADQQMKWVLQRTLQPEGNEARLVLANSKEKLEQLDQTLKSCPGYMLLDANDYNDLGGMFQSGRIVVAQIGNIEDLLSLVESDFELCLDIIITQRSGRYCEDTRNTCWLKDPRLSGSKKILVLAEDDELFADSPYLNMLKLLPGDEGRISNSVLEMLVRLVQRSKAGKFFRLRQGLLHFDTTMDNLLSFSGRGAV